MSIGLNVRLEKVAGMLAISSASAQQLKEGVVADRWQVINQIDQIK
jgi:hypothetical protein